MSAVPFNEPLYIRGEGIHLELRGDESAKRAYRALSCIVLMKGLGAASVSAVRVGYCIH